jgi:thiamine biosynthesis protein ThiC
MRCLLAADLHYSLQQFDWVNEVARYFDIVVLAGDHLDLGSIVDYRAQSAVVKKYIGKLKEKAQLLVRPNWQRSVKNFLQGRGNTWIVTIWPNALRSNPSPH